MRQLVDERTILKSDAETLVLTTHRVRYNAYRRGQSEVISIMLEHVASAGLTHQTYPFLLVLAALFLIGAALGQTDEVQITSLMLMAIAVAAYFVTRRGVLSIRSAGHSISVPSRSMSKDQLLEFIDLLDQAKNERPDRATPAG